MHDRVDTQYIIHMTMPSLWQCYTVEFESLSPKSMMLSSSSVYSVMHSRSSLDKTNQDMTTLSGKRKGSSRTLGWSITGPVHSPAFTETRYLYTMYMHVPHHSTIKNSSLVAMPV